MHVRCITERTSYARALYIPPMHIQVASLDVHLMYEQSMQKCSDIHCLQLSCTYDALQVEVHIYYIIKFANDAREETMHFLVESHNALLMRTARCTSNAHSTMHF